MFCQCFAQYFPSENAFVQISLWTTAWCTHPDLARTPLACSTSSGIHESQSRMIENIVGRSLGFWQAHYPTLQLLFPEQLSSHDVNAFYRAINKVQPSYIRVEADELTYNFHIILRFELEQAMLTGDLAVADLPTVWNDKMAELLGENIHQHGRKFTPTELVQQVTGGPFTHEPFLRYVTQKFSNIYEL